QRAGDGAGDGVGDGGDGLRLGGGRAAGHEQPVGGNVDARRVEQGGEVDTEQVDAAAPPPLHRRLGGLGRRCRRDDRADQQRSRHPEPTPQVHLRSNAISKCCTALTNTLASYTGSAPKRRLVSDCVSSSSATRNETRATLAPRQKWVPNPNAMCGLGSRVKSSSSGSLNTRSSRLADGYTSATRSPAFMGTPSTSVSSVTVRNMLCNGVIQRSSSSTAVGMIAGSAASCSHRSLRSQNIT